MHQFILYGSYLVFPFLAFVLYRTFNKSNQNNRSRILIVNSIVIILSLLFIYSRFIERYTIEVETTKINLGFKTKFALIADIHLGVYKSNKFLERVVNKINKEKDLDFLLIAGDFTYYPTDKNLTKLFSPLKKLKIKTYAVLGNHDSGKPGPPIQKKLKRALIKNRVIFLDNNYKKINNPNIIILGLGDNWASKDDIDKISQFKKEDNLLVLTHNPDTTLKYKTFIADLTLCGHTHGGQVRIPWIYKKAIPCVGDFDKGLYNLKDGKLFITSGLGEVGLPIRFLNPPIIDIIETY